MATIIDALLVTLGLDVTGFKKGQAEADEALKKTKDQAGKNAKELEAKAKQAADSFKGMRREIMSLVGAFASYGAVKGFVQNLVAGDAALGRLSQTLGMSTEELSAWHDMAEKFGGSAGDIDSALQHIQTFKENMKHGVVDDGMLRNLAMLLSPDELARFTSFATTTADAIKILQRAVAGSRDPSQAMNLMQQAGFTQGTVVVMREIGANLEGLISEQVKLNRVTRDNTEAAKDLAKAWQDAAKAMESWGRNVTNIAMPAMTALLKAAPELTKFLSGDPSAKSTLGTSLYDMFHADSRAPYKKRAPGDKGTGELDFLFNWLPSFRGGWLTDGINSFIEYGTPANKRKPKPVAVPAAAASSGAMRYGSSEFMAQFEADLRAGATFGGDALGRLTGSRAAAALLDSQSQKRGAGAGKTEVSIGTLNVNTKATDAPGIARDISAAIRSNFSLSADANYGTE